MDSIYELFLKSFFKRPMLFILKKNTLSMFVKLAITIAALVSLYYTSVSEVDVLIKGAVGFITPFALFIVVAPSVRDFYHHNDFVGYWTYTNKPDLENKEADFDQDEDKCRFVEIYRDSGSLRVRASKDMSLEGLLCDTDDTVLSGFGALNGRLIYKYTAPQSAPPRSHFSGFVVLEWQKPKSIYKVNEMSGRYYGLASQSMGTFFFRRIKKSEYEGSNKVVSELHQEKIQHNDAL